MDLMKEVRSFFESTYPSKTLHHAVARLQEKYAHGQYQFDRLSEYIAYVLYRMPATYGAVGVVLKRLQEVVPEFAPVSMVDVGAGPGSASIAALERFASLHHVDMVEREQEFCRLCSQWLHFCKDRDVSVHCADILPSMPDTVDLAVAAYTCGEWPESLVESWLMWASTHVKGALVIVEPGTPRGWEHILAYRSMLQAKGMAVVAPCPHDGRCPCIGTKVWCHTSVRIARSSVHRRLKSGELGYEDEKFTYLIAVPQPVERPEARIIGVPRHRSGHTHVSLCTGQGTLLDTVISKKHKDIYEGIKRAVWGDSLWKIPTRPLKEDPRAEG